MYDTNISEVPTLKQNLVISNLQTNVRALEPDEIEAIQFFLSYHDCEPMAAAERISDILNVEFDVIYQLL